MSSVCSFLLARFRLDRLGNNLESMTLGIGMPLNNPK